MKRWLADDLDAAAETAVLLGRSLDRLAAAVDRLGAEVTTLAERTERIEAALSPKTSS